MNLGMFRKLIEGLPDDTPIFKPAPDHALAYVNTISKGKVLREGFNMYTEWYEDVHGDEDTTKVFEAIIIE